MSPCPFWLFISNHIHIPYINVELFGLCMYDGLEFQMLQGSRQS